MDELPFVLKSRVVRDLQGLVLYERERTVNWFTGALPPRPLYSVGNGKRIFISFPKYSKDFVLCIRRTLHSHKHSSSCHVPST